MTFRDVLDEFKPAYLAEALRTTSHHVSIMKQRNSVPAAYWADLVAYAREQGKPEITFELLAEIAKERAA